MQNIQNEKNLSNSNNINHALVIGATGATGKDLLELLLNDVTINKVTVFVRKKIEVQHEKLNVHVIDFDKYEDWKNLVMGDVLFSCLGTTLKAAGSKEAQWKIDYTYQYQFAKAAKENQVQKYVLVSSRGANPNSFLFYPKLKGKLEDAVKELKFEKLAIFNPPILIRKDSDRKGEIIGIKMIQAFNKIGLLLSQKPLSTHILAQAMINAAKTNKSALAVFKGKEILECAGVK